MIKRIFAGEIDTSETGPKPDDFLTAMSRKYVPAKRVPKELLRKAKPAQQMELEL